MSPTILSASRRLIHRVRPMAALIFSVPAADGADAAVNGSGMHKKDGIIIAFWYHEHFEEKFKMTLSYPRFRFHGFRATQGSPSNDETFRRSQNVKPGT